MAGIAGVDEAGRGPLAGPVVAAAVILPENYTDAEVRDSKKLSKKKRELLYERIKQDALDWSIVAVGPHRIDKINILQATRLAMKLAVERVSASSVLIDGNTPIDIELPQQTVVGGDALHIQISAASILAKVWRDSLMKTLDRKYPGYDFAKHSGYPTKAHKQAISKIGPCRIHRKSFKGVSEFLSHRF